MSSLTRPFRRTALRFFPRALPILALLAAAPALRADSITYDVKLSPSSGVFGGTGAITVTSPPSTSGITLYSAKNGNLQGLSFLVDGQTFSLSGDKTAFVEFLNGKLYDITFAQTVGASPNRFTLDTSGVYAFYYDNGQAGSYGNMSAEVAQAMSSTSATTTATTTTTTTPSTHTTSPTPEPGSLLLLATALLAGGYFLLRRKRPTQS
jgi:hypothetical protein